MSNVYTPNLSSYKQPLPVSASDYIATLSGRTNFLLGHLESNILRVCNYTNCWHLAAVYFICSDNFHVKENIIWVAGPKSLL